MRPESPACKYRIEARHVRGTSLQWVQIVAFSHIFDGLDLAVLHFRTENEAGADQAAIDHYAAGAAVTETTTFFAAG